MRTFENSVERVGGDRNLFGSVASYFVATMPSPQPELRFGSTFQLLVAVVLSAQCTDKRVNIVTADLFKTLPDAKTMAEASVEQIFEIIKSVSFPNAKSNYLRDLSVAIMDRHSGQVPSSRAELEALSGVGHKTASVVLAIAFDQTAIAVDTHVFRVAHRLGLVGEEVKNPTKVEELLLKGFANNTPEETKISDIHHWLILHGRYVCQARKPKCGECGLRLHCADWQKRADLAR